jgi:hypothetical protein
MTATFLIADMLLMGLRRRYSRKLIMRTAQADRDLLI